MQRLFREMKLVAQDVIKVADLCVAHRSKASVSAKARSDSTSAFRALISTI
jgi:hypothetical protein